MQQEFQVKISTFKSFKSIANDRNSNTTPVNNKKTSASVSFALSPFF